METNENSTALVPTSIIVPSPRGIITTGNEVTDNGALELGRFSNFVGQRGQAVTSTLAEVVDAIHRWNDIYKPMDMDRVSKHHHITFDERGLLMYPIVSQGGKGVVRRDMPMRFSSNGLSQFASRLMGAHSLKFMRELSAVQLQKDDATGAPAVDGRKIAMAAWNAFNQAHGVDFMKFRTVQVGDERIIRAVMSTKGYAVFDDLDVLEAIAELSEYANMKVLQFLRWDTGMRLRLAAEEPRVGQPTQMIQIWNSEVGHSSIGMIGGLFQLTCTNGLWHWVEGKQVANRWVHSGGNDRRATIKDGFKAGLEAVTVEASGVIDDYQESLGTFVDDLVASLEFYAGDDLLVREKEVVTKALKDPTTHQNGSLGTIIDALTRGAQEIDDPWRQAEIEKVAVRTMRRGLTEAQQSSTGRLHHELRDDRRARAR